MMTNRGLLILSAGVLLVGVGLYVLTFPVYLDDYDYWGAQIKCGNGYVSDLIQAGEADTRQSGADYVGQCHTALAVRRAWTIPFAVVGWLILSGLAVSAWRHASAPDKGTADIA